MTTRFSGIVRGGLSVLVQMGEYRNKLLDWWYGVDTCGQRSVAELGVIGPLAREVYGFASTSFEVIRTTLARLPIEPEEWVFVDLGCGKGRVLLVAIGRPFRRVIGVELAPSLAHICRANLSNYRGTKRCAEVEVRVEDAVAFLPPACVNTIVYLFNPFSPQLLAECLKRLAVAPLAEGKRRIVCFVQQRTSLAPRVDLKAICPFLQPVEFAPLRYDWLSHPQLEVSLFDVRAVV